MGPLRGAAAAARGSRPALVVARTTDPASPRLTPNKKTRPRLPSLPGYTKAMLRVIVRENSPSSTPSCKEYWVSEPFSSGRGVRPTLNSVRLTHAGVIKILEQHGFDYDVVRARFRREWNSWYRMKARCHTPSDKSYPGWGGRGITVCEAWRQSFVRFLNDVGPAPSSDYSLDRIDVNGNYEPCNVRWADPTTQANNRRSNRFVEYKGERLTCAQWDRRLGLPAGTISARIRSGFRPMEAVTGSFRSHRKRFKWKKQKSVLARRRKYKGRWYTYAALDKRVNLPRGTVYRRVKKEGMSIERAVETPLRGSESGLAIPNELTIAALDNPIYGVTRTLRQWEQPNEFRNSPLPPRTIERRLRAGWTNWEAITTERYGRRPRQP